MPLPKHGVPALIAASTVVAACSPAKLPVREGSPPPSAPASVTETLAPDAGGASIPRTSPAPEAIGEEPEPRTIALEGAPAVTIRLIGAALIEVRLAAEGDDPGEWKTIEVERRATPEAVGGAKPQTETFTRPVVTAHRSHDGQEPARRALQTAKPGMTYRYRARSAGPWSEEVTLRVPEPAAVPPAPASATAQAQSPFAVRVSWEATGQRTAGFEVQVKQKDSFVRAALVNPTARQFVHHLRVPGEVVSYRVRAFNSRGASAPTPEVTLTMPVKTGAEATALPPLGRCVPAVRDAAPNSGGCNPGIDTLEAGDGRVLYNVPTAGNSCRRRLVGKYKGCLRELGAFDLQADVVAVPAWSDEGWPLLHAVAGAGQYVGAAIKTLQFVQGRYVVVDTAGFCGDRPPDADDLHVGVESSDLAASFPPFEDCQSDFSL